jgi:protoporphyrinogen oxidase
MEHHGAIDCAYVIFDEHRRKALPAIQGWLQRHGIHSIGRYGAWDYGSMGDAVLDGHACAEQLNAWFGQPPTSSR